MEDVWQRNEEMMKSCFFSGSTETMNKRRKGFPSETQVRRGVRVVHGDKTLEEKLGRNDLCPCGSQKVFKRCCLNSGKYDGKTRDYFFP